MKVEKNIFLRKNLQISEFFRNFAGEIDYTRYRHLVYTRDTCIEHTRKHMKKRFIYMTLLASLLMLGSYSSFAQNTDDAERYRQQSADKRRQAQRERQAERAQAAQCADLDSEVARETADYMAETARIQRHNNRIADYMTRDIAHRLAVWGDVGACTRLDQLGMMGGGTYSLSGAGALGIGYQLRHNKFLFTTGLEFRSINYVHTAQADPSLPPTYTSYNLGYLQIPLLLGMELDNWYWQLGAKAGYKLMDIHSTGLAPLRIAPAFEIGMNFDKWSRPRIPAGQQMTEAQRTQFRMHYKLALFGECGMFMHANAVGVPARLCEDMTIGVKFTAAYQFRRKQKTMEPLPTRPRPEMALVVKDANGRPVEGAVIQTHDRVSDGKSYATTLPDGSAVLKVARGAYDVRAFHKGKMAERLNIQHTEMNGERYELILDQEDNTPPEVKIVDEEEIIIDPNSPCLVGRVIDNETGKPLDAGVRFGNWIDTTALYHGTANKRGVYVTRLHRGDYSIHARKAGYMPLIDVIHFDKDSIILKLKPIRVGNAAKVKDLFFIKGKATLQPESETALANLAMFLRQNPDVCIRLTAHTDNQGDADRLERLSRARARMVRRNLVNRGIDINRIEIDGKGDKQPVADNETEYGRNLNQRMVMEITSIDGPKPSNEE